MRILNTRDVISRLMWIVTGATSTLPGTASTSARIRKATADVTEMVPGAADVLSGMIVSAAALLVAAGAAKMHGAVRGTDGDSAIRRAIGIWPGHWRLVEAGAGAAGWVTGAAGCAGILPAPAGRAGASRGGIGTGRGHWRLVEAGAGAAECVTGAAVCAGIFPALAGATMAGLGAGFTALLLHPRGAAAAGLANVALSRPGPPPFARPWFYAGVAAGSIMLALLSTDPASYRGLCGWQRWLPIRGTLARLIRHPVFAAMAGSAGPFGQEFGYRRAGCAAEFWFRASPESQCQPGTVVFRVRRLPGRALAVHASVQETMPGAARQRAGAGLPAPAARPPASRS